MRQNLLNLLFILMVISMVPIKAYGHSGGLDGDNCHTNAKTDHYHCHEASLASNDLPDYDRKSYAFRARKSPYNDSKIGYYTGIMVKATDVDHIVSLKDAHVSGAAHWPTDKKRQFANDVANHAPAVPSVNRKKSSLPPKGFIEFMEEPGYAYSFYSGGRKCEYVKRYIHIKKKYELSFENNDQDYLDSILDNCKVILALAHSLDN